MDGYLLIDKPAGISSFGVVAHVRRILSTEAGKKVKVGHTGTLDPAATGLMIIVVGAYCKKASEFSKLDKTYEVEATLGAVSTTGDNEGEISQFSTQKPTEEQVQVTLNKFIGDISQTPPIYSAIKVDGQRAYKLARAGKPVEMQPRRTRINHISDTKYSYPKLRFITEVSSGTYIRSLVEDIGKELGSGAYMSALNRTKISSFSLAEAFALDELNSEIILSSLRQLPSHP